jgi:hypothetical protein
MHQFQPSTNSDKLSETDNAATHLGVGGYGVNSGGGAAEDAAAAKIIFWVNTSVNWGCWNSTDAWLMGSGSTSNTPYRLAYTHNGTTARKFYVNGTETVDNTVAQRPTAGDTFFCGASRSTGAEPFRGAINFVYLRNGVLSANWLAAEAVNCITPASFYTKLREPHAGYLPLASAQLGVAETPLCNVSQQCKHYGLCRRGGLGMLPAASCSGEQLCQRHQGGSR